jgi:hypothetical protein
VIFFYFATFLIVFFVLFSPFWMVSIDSREAKDFFRKQGEAMRARDLAFHKEMIRESLEDVEVDLKSKKITDTEHDVIRDELYAQAAKIMKEEKS